MARRALLLLSALMMAAGIALLWTAPPAPVNDPLLASTEADILQQLRERLTSIPEHYFHIPLAEVGRYLELAGPTPEPAGRVPFAVPTNDPAAGLLAQAQSALAAGNLAGADQLLKQLQAQRPNFPGLNSELAKLNQARGDQAAIARRTDLANKANSAYANGNYAESLRLASALLREYPGDPEALRLQQLATLGLRKLTPASLPPTPPPPLAQSAPSPTAKPELPVGPPQAKLEAINRLIEGGSAKVRARITPADRVGKVVAYFQLQKKRGKETYKVMTSEGDGWYSADVPAEFIKRPGFEYRIEILDAMGRSLADPLSETVKVERSFEIPPAF